MAAVNSLTMSRLVDKLSGNIDMYRNILTKLVGHTQLDSLTNLSREELLQIVLASPEVTQGTSPSIANARAMSEINTGSDGAESLEALEQAPPEIDQYITVEDSRIFVESLENIEVTRPELDADIKQGPWASTEARHLRREFQYLIDTADIFGRFIPNFGTLIFGGGERKISLRRVPPPCLGHKPPACTPTAVP